MKMNEWENKTEIQIKKRNIKYKNQQYHELIYSSWEMKIKQIIKLK